MNKLVVKEKLEQFLKEDIGEGDLTSELVIQKDLKGRAIIKAKENGIMSGGDVLEAGYEFIDRSISVKLYFQDGEPFSNGDAIAQIEGNILNLLAGERVLLNVLQRMCGVATMTARAVETLNDKTIRICDTRKTTPGLRIFEKHAVRNGGGFNHRRGLDDAVLLKENHIAACGGITKAIEAVRKQVGHMVKVEVETKNEQEVHEAIEGKVDVIMFDNATPKEIAHYIQFVPDFIKTEASGGITLENLAEFAGCGVDYISLGCLTHSYKAIDLSFLLEEDNHELS